MSSTHMALLRSLQLLPGSMMRPQAAALPWLVQDTQHQVDPRVCCLLVLGLNRCYSLSDAGVDASYSLC